ncbi:MAG TPA: DUF6804 family protein [Candidatus Angelobacter sp.]
MSSRTEGRVKLTMLVLLMALWRPSADYGTLVQVAICAIACAVAFQTGEESRYFLATAFAAIAVLFNPIAPVMLSHAAFLWVGWASVGMFVVALVRLKKRGRVPISSISDATKRSETVDAVWAWKH